MEPERCNICQEECEELKSCENTSKDGKTDCQYKMCDKCLAIISTKLNNKCPQCRKDILSTLLLETEETEEIHESEILIDCVKDMGCITLSIITVGTCFVINAVTGAIIFSTCLPGLHVTLVDCNSGTWFRASCVGTLFNTCLYIGCKIMNNYCQEQYDISIFNQDSCCCCCKYLNRAARANAILWNNTVTDDTPQEQEMER